MKNVMLRPPAPRPATAPGTGGRIAAEVDDTPAGVPAFEDTREETP